MFGYRCGGRLSSAALVVAAIATTMAACGHSATTAPSSGSGPAITSHGLEVDSFIYDVTGPGTWTLTNGLIDAYLLEGAAAVTTRGMAAPQRATPQVTARLLTDTIEVEDSLTGPPAGTDLQVPSYLAYDQTGDIWMSVAGKHNDGSVVEYTRAQQSQNGSLTPNITLTGLQVPVGLTFDVQGNLWVVDSQATKLLGYTMVEQETGAAPAISASLAGIVVGGATWAPIAVALDSHRNIWISARPRTLPSGAAADSVAGQIVVEFTDSAISAGGTPTPVLVLTQTGLHPSGYGPGIAFDAMGNLWTANASLGTVTSFAAASLTAGAHPTPAVTITGTSLQGVADIVFDAAGVMYIGGGGYGSPGAGIFAFSPASLGASGSPTPKLAFNPTTGVSHFAIR